MKKILTMVGQTVRAKALKVTASGLVQVNAVRAYKPTKSEKRLMAALLTLGSINQTMAQGSAVSALKSVQTTVISIVQVLFAIFLVIALIRTAKKLMSGEPDAMTSVAWLVGGVLLFFGFQFFKDDLVANVGGGQGGVK